MTVKDVFKMFPSAKQIMVANPCDWMAFAFVDRTLASNRQMRIRVKQILIGDSGLICVEDLQEEFNRDEKDTK